MKAGLRIGEVAKRTGLTTKSIRYYELLGLLPEPQRTESGYRLYGQEDVEHLSFIQKAKRLGLSLADIRDILSLHRQRQRPCIHVLALLDRKLRELDDVLADLQGFREELAQLREESAEQLQNLPEGSSICGIIERGIHHKGELALAWLEGRQKAKRRHQGEGE
jgi:DNA-binding transcriptional MerR regulator